jgi:uncharacterized RDD family membrane protein YckC
MQESVEQMTMTPSLGRRLLCMVYEGLLLFGVVFVASLLFLLISRLSFLHFPSTEQNPLPLQIWLFFVIGFYFVFAWHKGGQTLAMKTWRLRVIDLERAQLPIMKGVVRYLLAWMWFVPGLALAAQLHLSGWLIVLALAINMLLWSGTRSLSAEGQFLHDKLAKTRVIQLPPGSAKKEMI